MSDSAKALEALHAAIQDFSNAICSDDGDVGLVTSALLVWEEASYSDAGSALRTTMYAATGDAATPAGSLGLAYLGLERVRRDVVGGCGR